MRVGIPKGLLQHIYYPFFETFFRGLGAGIVSSEDTNQRILNLGVQFCVDEACLPVKVYHGHVASIMEYCDFLVVPRIMRIYENEFICPKFCGLPEMVKHSIPGLPQVSLEPLYMQNDSLLFQWCLATGSRVTGNKRVIREAFQFAKKTLAYQKTGIHIPGRKLTVMLAGHPYILYDSYLNMGINKKLADKGVGIITEEYADRPACAAQVKKLVKKPFWTFQRNLYGAAAAFHSQQKIDGIIYLSSFACGIDSIVIDLIRYQIGDFPLLVLKLDEHTGEAGVDTRLEAFIDMLERRTPHENNHTASGKCLSCNQNPV